MKRTKNPEFMFILSVFIFGTLGPFVRNSPVSSGELALYRAILAVVLIGVYLAVTGQKIPFGEIISSIPLLLISGAAIGFNWVLLFEAYKLTTITAATLSYYFAPVIVTVLSPVLFREKITARQWICFIMSTLGIVLITGVERLSGDRNHILGIAFGLGAACFYAAVILLNKYIRNVDGIHRTLLQFLASIAVMIPYVALTGGVTIGNADARGLIFILIIGIFHTGITYCMYFSSLKELPGQKVAILSYIDPLVAVMISVVILGEELTPMQALGGALILGFTLWNEITPKKREKEEKI